MNLRTQLTVTAPAGTAVVALRNLDGARTLLFAVAGGAVVPLTPGEYGLAITYLREVAGLPTQRIASSSAPSNASITLTVTADAAFPVEVL